ncbi:50S ribosomal protein L11 [candidate division WWE3 bacterium RBG_19FT_COMBO_53_11]|uniref:Large ribosomal subunit protein uL11 n=1 Tax=candidate division WWE3 bacterium RBG_19FT_COMBO_53_11 TaxID=1802613 RepID=A0A1F4UJ65_UNCKA|nr:MAG: 50S ribosomal protein L11 [candidate division WWE3 bacterium RBG_16_52_45]OGC45001.1 MAG: 50S ribosomal protein L11 [candidate division WWE3 bacterium RBG_19FT_COMBO_53_11]
MAKKVKATLKLNIPAGEATPAPPIGPALGQHGVAIMDFCKAYNEKTSGLKGQIIPAVVTIYGDRSFTFVTKTPPTGALIKKAAGVEKGSGVTPKEKTGKITRQQAREIAEQKMVDLNAKDIESAIKIIEGQARSMGIDVE